jgi:2-amino-4-hydroxy-6-hydroxymethyldihydropteridine diphosphokinase
VRVFVGLGSNVGDRRRFLRKAVEALGRLPGTRVVKVSRVYETSPVGPRQRDFLNAAAEVRTALSPAALLAALKAAERSLGRRPRGKWGPREIDLDILYFGGRVARRGRLRVPHPRRAERLFVLKPLAELAPRFRDPLLKKTVASLLAALTGEGQRITLFRGRP